MLRFATLGPEGTNSEQAVRRYLDAQGLRAEILLLHDYSEALELLRSGRIDHFVQVCAHPDVAETIEQHHTEVFVVDSFVAPTKPMGVLTRVEVVQPRSVGLMPATKGYFDVARWPVHVPEISTAEVARGLLEGRYDSGFTTLDLLDTHPNHFRLDRHIGEVDVAWLVYGRERVREGAITVWLDSPLARHLRAKGARAHRQVASTTGTGGRIRAVTTDDLPTLRGVIDATGLFPGEMLDDMLAPHLSGAAPDEIWLTLDAGTPAAIAYCAPERMTAGCWNLLLIAVHPERQGRGHGAALVAHLERALAARRGRILMVETSGLPEFEPTRDFYRSLGFGAEARIRDFYAEGEDKIIFRKALVGAARFTA